MTKYTATTSFALASGLHARRGDVVELTDAEAKPLHKSKAIGLYLEEGDEFDDALPKAKPRTKKREGKPASPAALDDSQMMAVDPKAT